MSTKRPKLSELSIRSLRGIVDLRLELNAKSLVLQGANGHGKSSLVDALELLLLGSISHLEGKQTLSLVKHGKHVKAQDSDVQVTAKLNDGGTLARGLAGSLVSTGSGADYARDAIRRTFLLRRSQLLAFIHADPADRFRELAALIGITRLDGLELAFKRTADTLTGALDADRQLLADRTADLTALTGLPASALVTADVLKVVNARLAAVSHAKAESLAEAAGAAVSLVDPAKVSALTRELVALEAAQAGARELLADAETLADLDGEMRKVATFRERGEARRAASLSTLIEEGKRYVIEYAPAACPLCEQSTDPSLLLERLRTREQELRELTDEASALRTTAATLATKLNSLAARLASYGSQHARLLEETVVAQLHKSAAFAKSASALLVARGLLDDGRLPTEGEAERNMLTPSLSAAATHLSLQAGRLKPSGQEKAVAEVMQDIMKIAERMKDLTDVSTKVRRGTALTKRAKMAQVELVAAKNEIVADIYGAIKADVDRFYEHLHPGEPHGNVVIDVSKRASTGLWMDSFGVAQQDPRAFSSEGHLDSLGLCIFLAFANTFQGECNLLILDDVIMSIDAGHRKRIADLLITAFDNCQLIVTTHDRIWFQELTDAEKAHGRHADFLNLRILDWSVSGGPLLSNHVPIWDLVAEKIGNGDLVGAGGDTRRNLEWVLQDIAELVRAEVPYQREPRYTADVLYQPVKLRLAKLCPARTDAAIKTLESSKAFGNMLVHATAETEAFSKEEVQDFAKAVKQLHDSFCCDSCGALLHYDQPAKVILCRNPKCKQKTLINTG